MKISNLLIAFVFTIVCYGCNTNSKSEQPELTGNDEKNALPKENEQPKENARKVKIEKYFDVGDAKIHYEVSGNGIPILLLHGGLYGSIDEFNNIIPQLSRNYKVIAVTTRGHGKSEIGTRKFSYRQFAEDAMAVLKNEDESKAIVMGFSDGAITAYVLAAEFPNNIIKVVAMSGALGFSAYQSEGKAWVKNLTPENFEKDNPEFVITLKSTIPEPQRWKEFLVNLKAAWAEPVYVSDEKAKQIKCPVLTIAGDRDFFIRNEHYVKIHTLIPKSQLAIIPNSGHVDVLTKAMVFKDFIQPFL